MTNKVSFVERQNRRRKRKVNSIRTKQGIKEIMNKRLKLIMFLLFIIIVICIWFLFVYAPNNTDIFRMLIYIVYWLLTNVCIWGIIMWFGKPKNAQKIEDSIKDVFNIKEEHKVPILKVIKKRLNGMFTYGFYSPDYSEEKYEEKRIDIEQKLRIIISGNVESDGEFIYFTAIPKKNIKLKKELKDDRIFTSKEGLYMHPGTCDHALREIVKKYNLDPICFHELRPTCASLLINSGIDPKTVSKRLGHADTSITMEIYTHSFEASKIACANKFDEMMKQMETI